MQSKKTLLLLSLTSMTVLLQDLSFAQDYGIGNKLEYHGGTTHVRLGGGVNKNFPLKYKKTCIENVTAYDPDSSATGSTGGFGTSDGFDSTISSSGAGVPETAFDIEFIQDTEEMDNLLSISGLIAAQLKFRGRKLPGLNIDARSDKEYKLNDTTLNLVLKVKSNFGRQMIKDDVLKEEYQKMLEDGDFKNFEKYCGTHYVAWQRRQGIVSAILTVSDLTEEQKKNLRASFEIGSPPDSRYGQDYDNKDNWGDSDNGNNDGWDDDSGSDDDWDDWDDNSSNSLRRETDFQDAPLNDLISKPSTSNKPAKTKGIGARFSINNFLQAVRKIGKKASLKFYANGGGGPQHLGKLATSFNGGKNSFQDVLEGIGHYLENFSFHSAPPVEYYLVPYFDFVKQEADIDHALLKSVYYSYVDAENNMVSIKEHLETLSTISDKEEILYFREKMNQLDGIRTVLWDMGENILDGVVFNMEDIPIVPRINWSRFIPQVKNAKYSFNCFSQNNIEKCGTPSSFLKPTSYWQATFDVNARITLPHKIKSVGVLLKGRSGGPKLMGKVENGESIKDEFTTQEFNVDNRGMITFNLAKMTQKNNRNRYINLMDDVNNIPQAMLVIELNNGQKIEIPLGTPKSIGNHAKWKLPKTTGTRTELF